MEATTADFTTIKVKTENRIATITLDHPPVNSLNKTLLADLDKALDQIAADKDVRVVVITGSGSHAFCAGADLKEFEGIGPEGAEEMLKFGQSVFNKIASLPQPVIAAVNSLTLGGGNELALSCDMRIASDRARFGQPEVWIGLLPAWGGTQRMTQLLGPAKAKELILTGQMVNAQEAYRIGLINKVVPDGEEVRAAIDIARMIIAKSAPLAVAASKRAINKAMESSSLEEGLTYERKEALKLAGSKDLVEGITAFVEKRQPEFKGE
ncbi:MAG: enoyl-CoA hydratase/isomerase family protein [Euryarchaeota archaeon]|nr:enoyl-CoA hydratase/isomerase family protein [Euryarchaeota archaeon]